MKKIVVSALLAAGLTGGALLPVQAQVVSIDAVLAACATATATIETCAPVQDAYIAQLQAQGLTQAELDAAIGTMVVRLAEAAPANPALVSAAISRVAVVISDPAQTAAVVALASAVASGAPVSTTIIAQAASPN